MAITSIDALVANLAAGQKQPFSKASITTAAGFWYSLWNAAGQPGAGSYAVGNTSAGVVPTDATIGCGPVNAFAANPGYLTNLVGSSATAGILRIYDRVYHAGTYTTASLATTNLSGQPSFSGRVPGANYSQCELWLEITAACGATNTTVTFTYTDQDANPGASGTFDPANFNGLPLHRMYQGRLAAGDTGVSKLESVTVGGATGTLNFNLVILRPLAQVVIPLANVVEATLDPFKLGLPQIYDTSCLAFMFLATAATSGTVVGQFGMASG
jgi:hypothetical protein